MIVRGSTPSLFSPPDVRMSYAASSEQGVITLKKQHTDLGFESSSSEVHKFTNQSFSFDSCKDFTLEAIKFHGLVIFSVSVRMVVLGVIALLHIAVHIDQLSNLEIL